MIQKKIMLWFIICFLILSCSPNPNINELSYFKEAVPVWEEGREKEMNLTLGFRASFKAKDKQEALVKITASTLYRVYVNGEFVGSGPARAAHGHYRVDVYQLDELLVEGENILAIEVAGYNVNSYYTLDQPSFLLAEAEVDGEIVAATGKVGHFEAFQLTERLQNVERYSFQRPFTEYYRIQKGYDKWRTSIESDFKKVNLTQFEPVSLLARNVAMPTFDVQEPVALHSIGTLKKTEPERYHKDRSLTAIGDKLKGFKENELEVYPVSLEIQEIHTHTQEIIKEPFTASRIEPLEKDRFNIYDFGTNFSGFIGARLECLEPSRIIFYFDEILIDDDVKTKQRQSDICNHIVYELQPGVYDLETIESYTFRYLKLMVMEGEIKIENIYLRKFSYPDNMNARFESNNAKLNKIFDAAKQTFRQNSVDVFMDCPSRERAGWLCDSYFSAITERVLTGRTDVADNFLENYALPEKFEYLPDGMIPMCYPADHNDGIFIPNWSLWFILQVNDYAHNGGNPNLVADLKPRIENLLDYFAKFENPDGLLEKLESWVFVEWSKANDLVQDVNYPTNMLYSAALERAGKLYENHEWSQKAKKIKETVLKQSDNGEFFVDNAIRDSNGELMITTNTTEVCQYYAFFFNIATPDSHPELWRKIAEEFGPNRDVDTTYPNVFRANAFIGNYLRMDILSRYNMQSQLILEIQDYFYSMAQQTGTLWEHMESYASCNHGFASYISHILYRDVLGVRQIDSANKHITIQFTNIDLEQCTGSINIDEELLHLEWKRNDNSIQYELKVPEGYTFDIENRSGLELILAS